MRILTTTIFDQLNQAMQKTMTDWATANSRIATGKKLLVPSDDVSAVMRAMDYRVSLNDNSQFSRNIDSASNALSFTNTLMTSLNSTVSDIKKVLNSAINASTPALQSTFTQQLDQYRNMLLDTANTKYVNQYIFTGFTSSTQPYNAVTHAYQGDVNPFNVQIDKGATVQVNTIGSDVFSYSIGALGATYAMKLSGGQNVHYTQGAGTTINVEIRQADDVQRVGVDDTFSFSNVIQMTDTLSAAVTNNNTLRVEALQDPFNRAQNQLNASQAGVGARLDTLKTQTSRLTDSTATLQDSLSATENADMNTSALQLQMADTTLQALRSTAAKILSQSLLDFLK
jgi:flagellar hook-associated protein 3 FlgL